MELITVNRISKTHDGWFGMLTLNFDPFTCVTMEKTIAAIPQGLFRVIFTQSPHFGRIMPQIVVPERDALAVNHDAGIRIHWANWPTQLQGCIAVGRRTDGDAIDESKVTFNELFELIKYRPDLFIQVLA